MAERSSGIGKAKELEVASAFAKHGLLVYVPLLDVGADLVVGNATLKRLIPVQVKYRANDPGLALERKFVEAFAGTDLFIAFLIGEKSWFIPIARFRERMKDRSRRDGKVYITVSEERSWLKQFEGLSGIRLLSKTLSSNRAVENDAPRASLARAFHRGR